MIFFSRRNEEEEMKRKKKRESGGGGGGNFVSSERQGSRALSRCFSFLSHCRETARGSLLFDNRVLAFLMGQVASRAAVCCGDVQSNVDPLECISPSVLGKTYTELDRSPRGHFSTQAVLDINRSRLSLAKMIDKSIVINRHP